MSFGFSSPQVALIGVMAAWFALAIAFLAIRVRSSRDRSSRTTRSRDARAWYGFLGQAAAFAVIWMWRRAPGTDLVTIRPDVGWALAGLAIALSAAAVWLSTGAMIALGRFWAVGARVADDHRLVTAGPFALVRHPIYTGLSLLLLASGVAWSTPEAIVIAAWVFGVSTHVRALREEKLLSSALGTAYAVYAARVPRFVPRLWPVSSHPVDREAAFVSIYFVVYLVYLFIYQEGDLLHWVSLVLIPVSVLPLLGFYRSLAGVLESIGLASARAPRGLLLVLPLGVVVQGVQLLNTGQREDLLRILREPYGWLMPFAAFALLLCTVAATEEIFFRGLLQTRLTNRLRSSLAGWVLASLAFTAYHLPYAYLNPAWPSAGHLGQAIQLAAANGLLAGFVIGAVYWRTGQNLVAAILLHACIDLIPATRLVAAWLHHR
jgi:protein-S-isoprenylcysteine O-methyltransferase Ste14/membrane protease YdiL (CAAX protease family)